MGLWGGVNWDQQTVADWATLFFAFSDRLEMRIHPSGTRAVILWIFSRPDETILRIVNRYSFHFLRANGVHTSCSTAANYSSKLVRQPSGSDCGCGWQIRGCAVLFFKYIVNLENRVTRCFVQSYWMATWMLHSFDWFRWEPSETDNSIPVAKSSIHPSIRSARQMEIELAWKGNTKQSDCPIELSFICWTRFHETQSVSE